MSDSRPLYEQAYDDYKKGFKYKEIAEKYNVSINTVKSWKSRYWNKKGVQAKPEKVAHKNEKGCTQKLKRGAPAGNQNAKGNSGGPPKGSQNNLKHGIYEKMLFCTLTDEEKELLCDLEVEEEVELKKTVKFCDLKIVRYMRRIQDAKEKPGGLVVHNVSKTDTKIERSDLTKTTHTNTISTTDLILKYEAEIQKYTKQKVRCLETLLKLGHDTYKLELELMKVEATIKSNDVEETQNTNLLDALEATAKGVWDDD